MKIYTRDDIETMDKRFRVNFINSLSGFKSLNLIGTVSESGVSNLAPFSSVVHLGADPALIGMVSRPDSVLRGTLKNILETGWYSINHVTEDMVMQAHQCGARYAEEESEFQQTGLTELYENHKAPMVQESPLSMMVEYKEHHRLDINNTVFIIGQIAAVRINDESIIRDSGYIDLEAQGTITCTGLDSYHKTQRTHRLAYAKADKALQSIDEKA